MSMTAYLIEFPAIRCFEGGCPRVPTVEVTYPTDEPYPACLGHASGATTAVLVSLETGEHIDPIDPEEPDRA